MQPSTPQQGSSPMGGGMPSQSPQPAPSAPGSPTAIQSGGSLGGGAHQQRGAPRGQSGPGHQSARLQPVRIEDIVQEDVVTASPETPVRTLVAQMAERNVGAVVVVDDDEPTGVITDRTIALAIEDQPDVGEQDAESLLGGDVVTADPSMTVFDAVRSMSEHDIRRLPVVDENDALQGVVTLDDVLVLLGTELENAAEVIQSQSPRL